MKVSKLFKSQMNYSLSVYDKHGELIEKLDGPCDTEK